MSQSIRATPVDLDRRQAIRSAASEIATPAANGRLGLVKHAGWVAVAATEGLLRTEHWREGFAAWLSDHDVDAVYGVVLNRECDEPPLEIGPSAAGVGSLLSDLGGWNFVLFGADGRWAIVVTREDIAAFLGQAATVDGLLGIDPAAARAEVEQDFSESEGFWPEAQQALFRALLAAIDQYADLAPGDVVALPLEV
jgi:hypothetical protein